MTEAEWQACTDPTPMLDFLKGKTGDRKLRLFGCACCRQFRQQMGITALAEAIEATEWYADTGKTKAALKLARQGVKAIRHGIPSHDKTRVEDWAALWFAEVAASENAYGGVSSEVIRLTSLGLIGPEPQAALPGLMHCLFGPDPCHPLVLQPSWLTQDLTVLAQTIYDERAFERMPELADALEKAGCTQADIVAHCRAPGPHVRGCWVVDCILGKG